VGPRRWAAIGLGLLGVLIMLRPDEAGGITGTALALLAALGLAARDMTTRLAPPEAPSLQLAVLGLAWALPVGLVLVPLTGGVSGFSGAPAAFALGAAVFNMVGYLAITAAMRSGEVSVVAPFRYTRLLFSLFIAVLFLGERPDAPTLIGAAIVIGSGLFVFWRERVAAARSAADVTKL
jgi:drug/metabolite transporter (DMT)-like permease